MNSMLYPGRSSGVMVPALPRIILDQISRPGRPASCTALHPSSTAPRVSTVTHDEHMVAPMDS